MSRSESAQARRRRSTGCSRTRTEKCCPVEKDLKKKMRQIVLRRPGELEERSVSLPAAGPQEVLMRIDRVGVCGSDFHAFAGAQPAYTYPRVMGHEISGRVVEIPENERGIRVGDICAIEPYINCGHCRTCRLDRPNCCEELKLFGVHVDGGMQGYLAVPMRLLHKSDSLTLDQLALVETLGIGANAVRRSGLAKGETALVVGAGPIGLAVTQFAVAAGATVRVVEQSALRREFVRQFGVEARERPDGELADVVFDATGSAKAMAESLWQVAAGGRLVFVGLCRDAIAIDDPVFHKREVTLYASRNSCHQFPRIIGMIERGEIDTAPWINFRMPLRDVPKGFAELRKRPDLIKAMIEVEDSDAMA